ncbi:MAG: hypothetical protein H7Z19_23820, partial [Chitinophagaceae bacterium]|nr:hypothetical protein [Rubrivivax sp.]
MTPRALQFLCCLSLAAAVTLAHAQTQSCPATLPALGAPPPAPLPLFPATNWWNLDIRSAPVDAASS